MALKAQSLLLFGFEITKLNSSLDFRSTMGGPIRLATLNLGFYSLTDLMAEIKRAMEAADPSNHYSPTANRTISGGTQNRVTIATSGSYLDLLFGSGPRVASSVGPLIGFAPSDRTGTTTYTGTTTAGTALVTEREVYNYTGPDIQKAIFGAVNVSASGDKEAIVWQVQKFFDFNAKFEPEAKVLTDWSDFMTWAIQQKPLEFTPEVTTPTLFYNCTLEGTAQDGKGLGFKMQEQLPDFPFYYQTGQLRFRVKET